MICMSRSSGVEWKAFANAYNGKGRECSGAGTQEAVVSTQWCVGGGGGGAWGGAEGQRQVFFYSNFSEVASERFDFTTCFSSGFPLSSVLKCLI